MLAVFPLHAVQGYGAAKRPLLPRALLPHVEPLRGPVDRGASTCAYVPRIGAGNANTFSLSEGQAPDHLTPYLHPLPRCTTDNRMRVSIC